jgi:hypothetical protein
MNIESNNLVYTLALVVITGIVTAALSIHVKHSTTKEEAYDGLLQIVANIANLICVAGLLYITYSLVVSEAPLTRAAVFQISLSVSSIASIAVMKIFLILFNEQRKIASEHLKITQSLVDLSGSKISNDSDGM